MGNNMSKKSNVLTFLALGLSALALVACGGGGSSTSNNDTHEGDGIAQAVAQDGAGKQVPVVGECKLNCKNYRDAIKGNNTWVADKDLSSAFNLDTGAKWADLNGKTFIAQATNTLFSKPVVFSFKIQDGKAIISTYHYLNQLTKAYSSSNGAPEEPIIPTTAVIDEADIAKMTAYYQAYDAYLAQHEAWRKALDKWNDENPSQANAEAVARETHNEKYTKQVPQFQFSHEYQIQNSVAVSYQPANTELGQSAIFDALQLNKITPIANGKLAIELVQYRLSHGVLEATLPKVMMQAIEVSNDADITQDWQTLDHVVLANQGDASKLYTESHEIEVRMGIDTAQAEDDANKKSCQDNGFQATEQIATLTKPKTAYENGLPNVAVRIFYSPSLQQTCNEIDYRNNDLWGDASKPPFTTIEIVKPNS